MKNFIFAILVIFLLSANAISGDGEKIFATKCAACHTIGKGRLVGPDLKDVIKRRDIMWLKGFIKAPSEYFKRNEEIAIGLLKEYSVPMPDLGLTDEEVEAVIAHLVGGEIVQLPTGRATPPYHTLTISVGVVGAILLTILALWAGRKKLEIKI
jgi:cytochrome c551/c552